MGMDVIWPNLKRHTSDYLRLCGSIVEPSAAAGKWLKKKRNLVSSFRKTSKTYYVRFVTGGRVKNHFHIEIASAAMISPVPESTAKLREIQECFSNVEGLAIDIKAGAEFESRTVDLPDRGLIRLFTAENRLGEVSMKMTRGVFTLSGSPVRRISWNLFDGSDRVSTIIEGQRAGVVSATYLVDLYEWLFEMYSLFVLGRNLQV
jgi:hypothetical protein